MTLCPSAVVSGIDVDMSNLDAHILDASTASSTAPRPAATLCQFKHRVSRTVSKTTGRREPARAAISDGHAQFGRAPSVPSETGKLIVISVYSPGALSTAISPPCSRTMSLDSDRPRPVP